MPDQTLTGTPGAAASTRIRPVPRLYYWHPLLAGPVAAWPARLAEVAALGFTDVLMAPPFAPPPGGSLLLPARHDILHPELGVAGPAAAGLRTIARAARAAGLGLWLDLVVDRVAAGSPLANAPGSPFTQTEDGLNPMRLDPEEETACAQLDEEHWPALATFWRERLTTWLELGLSGFRLLGLARLPAGLVRALSGAVTASGGQLLGWTPGVAMPDLPRLAGCGLDYVVSSLPWWDGQADWFWQEQVALRAIAPVLHPAEAPFGIRLAAGGKGGADALAAVRRGLNLAALMGDGWLMPMGAEFGVPVPLETTRAPVWDTLRRTGIGEFGAEITALNQLAASLPRAAVRAVSAPGGPSLALLRTDTADARGAVGAALVAVDVSGQGGVFCAEAVAPRLGGYFGLDAAVLAPRAMSPGGHAVVMLARRAPERVLAAPGDAEIKAAAAGARIGIENVSPSVEGGEFAARLVLGERLAVEADLIADGHDLLAAVIELTAPDGSVREVPMRLLANDRWRAECVPDQLGAWRAAVVAWKDVFASFRDELGKKTEAGLDVALEVEEGRNLLRAAAARVTDAGLTAAIVESGAGNMPARVAVLLSEAVREAMRAADGRAHGSRSERPVMVEVERTAARFASWYEIFPRSMSGDGVRHGTFADVIRELPRIRAMGFDVLYFPPIHPIGWKNRKGRNNALTAEAGDPGSPYGIADHKALHAELGNFEDFSRLRAAAAAHGLEIALDFAVQCAPDHPWLAAHPGWFDWRPDGSIKYAENPPKKYQDIVNVDFYAPDAVPDLWRELCDVVLFWCERGVRIFRVDNPHTKPLPFWAWMIKVVRARYSDAIFLAEAFTRPKMMYRLAKLGFSQSYTYFTWRNTKAELTEYLTELTTSPARLFFRPHFFVNTPDINPYFLQTSGRAGHLIRAVLAATLSGLFGVYCGFELCEAAPLPGREEYQDSEKYQLRAWDWNRPGNIVAEITRLNQIRAANPALQTHLGVTFLTAHNDQILLYEKATEDRTNVVLVAVNLDPHAAQEASVELPLWRWGLPDGATLAVEDLMGGARFTLTGKAQLMRLDPAVTPFLIWRLTPA